ncbi:MAG: hypothetical protein HOW73_08290 [Polyangiaceae bacterium]|nr:hypothetical protein [Polyangiaceae bacterium]
MAKPSRRPPPTWTCALFGLGLLGCGAAEHQYVVPWLRIATEPRHVIAPHALEFGGAKRLERRDADGWRRLPHDGYSIVVSLGSGVVVEDGGARGFGARPPHNLFIYHPESSEPIRIAGEDCPSPRFASTEIGCFSCSVGKARVPLDALTRDTPCETLHIRRFDEFGKLIEERSDACPIALPDVEGRTTDGAWILAETKHNPDFLFMYGPKPRFRLDAFGITSLPFGSDPLAREIDAAGRAKEILEQVPIRDAALATMREELAAEESSHPELTRIDDVETRLRAGIAIALRVESAPPGSCFEVVARSTADLESMEVRVRRSTPGEAAVSPPVAVVAGRERVTLSYCVGSTPETLELPIVGIEGRGYVAARLYRHALP